MNLQGIYPPIATPFTASGDLYPAKVKSNVEQWNRIALSGYVVSGSTGESVLLTTEERLELWRLVGEAAAPGKTLIAGTGMESVRETVHLTNCAADLGYTAAMVRTPHYYKTLLRRPEAQALYFRAVADEAKIPLIIYNWPQTTGLDISPETVVELSQHPNIIAIKESSGDLEKVMRLVRETDAGFGVLVGSAPTLWPSLAVGAVGAVLAFANAAPYATMTIWEAHRSRETEAAREWQGRIARAARLVTVQHGVPGLKYAMDLMGYYGGPPRLPLVPPDASARREIELAFVGLRG